MDKVANYINNSLKRSDEPLWIVPYIYKICISLSLFDVFLQLRIGSETDITNEHFHIILGQQGIQAVATFIL